MTKTKLSFSPIPIAVFIILEIFIFIIFIILNMDICIIRNNLANSYILFTLITMILLTLLGISEDRYRFLYRRFIFPEIPNIVQIIALPSILITLVKDSEGLSFLAPLILFFVSIYLLEKEFKFRAQQLSDASSIFNIFKMKKNKLDKKFDLYFAITIMYLFVVIILFVKLLEGAC